MNSQRIYILWLLLGILFAGCPGTRITGEKENLETVPVYLSEFNGLRLAYSPGNEALVTFKIIFSGGTENYPEALEGIEKLALRTFLLSRPKGVTGFDFEREMARSGMQVDAFSGTDDAYISMICPANQWRDAWDLFTRWLMQPELDFETFEKARSVCQLEAKLLEQSHEAALVRQSTEKLFAGKIYARNPDGTEAGMKRLEFEQTRDYFTKFLLNKCRMVVAWAGKPGQDEVVEKILTTLDGLPGGNCSEINEVIVPVQAPEVQFVERPLPQHLLRGAFSGPPCGSPEAAALAIAMEYLEASLKTNLVETSETFANSVDCGLTPHTHSTAFVNIRTSFPNRCGKSTLDLIEKIGQEGILPAEWEKTRQAMLMRYQLSSESGEERTHQARKVLWSENPEQALQWPGYLKAVDYQEGLAAFRKYATAVQWTILGSKSKVDEEFFLKKPDFSQN